MIADLLNDAAAAAAATSAATAAAAASDLHADFAQQHPLQIAVCLRKLISSQDFVAVEFGGRQIVSQVLDVDSRNARFVFDAGSVAADNRALPAAQRLVFRSLPGSIRTEFATAAAEPVVFEGRLAFEAPFPALLYYVQRREFFRVQTPLLEPYRATGRYEDGEAFKVELQDLSLGGVALRTADARFGALEAGCVLRNVAVQLGDYGILKLDLEIVAPRHSFSASGECRFIMGCKFVALPGTAERMLQRVITQLETRRQALAPRE
ncbi:MAG: flagellar brake protein [Paraburkholderia sp.]|jgi:c-di-GMP-binding flagellar brake protein YcgR|uniref:flagellar brake protein n=1 Tax=Burkholderiaceae TaxID=119060 RepID=UPI0010F5A581|nr:flagellar brake protein [Burkholderia sp. 4M9327F10]